MKKRKIKKNRFMRVAGEILLLAALPVLASVLMGCPAEASPGASPNVLTYTIIYNANNATGGTVPGAQTKTEDVDLVLSMNDGNLVRTNYGFAGWNTAADGSGTDYEGGETYTTNADITLYAQWGAYYTSAKIGTLVYVPKGSFQRDSTSTNISVITKAYRMSEHEITRAQFLDIMGTDPSDDTISSGTSDPVQTVNWYHAIAFCNKLSIAEGLTQVYSVTVSGTPVDFSALVFGDIPTSNNDTDWNSATADWSADGYRLPTEMEWMWAAMGAIDDFTKPFAGSNGSNVIGDYAWYTTNSNTGSGKTTHPVGTKLPNELGLYDMSGNVWEWNWDWQQSYPVGTLTDYRGPDPTSYRIFRGGPFNQGTSYCTVADRVYDFSGSQFNNVGFRVVRP